MKLCKDCKYLEKYRGNFRSFSNCLHPNNMVTNKVTGKSVPRYSASSCRIGDRVYLLFSRNSCGEMARWFEPREVP